MQNHSGGDTDSLALGIVSLYPHLLGSRSPPLLPRRQLGVKHVELSQQTKEVLHKAVVFTELFRLHTSMKRTFSRNENGPQGQAKIV